MQSKNSVPDGSEDWSDLPTEIVEKVAQAKGVDLFDLAPLQSVVDADALTDLCAHPGSDVEVAFVYEGCQITVDSDGQVWIDT